MLAQAGLSGAWSVDFNQGERTLGRPRAAVLDFARETDVLINVMGLWGVGLLGGYMLGLTDTIGLGALDIATPIGVPGFWAAAIVGMFVSAAGIALYFFTVSATPRMRRA